MPSPNMTVINDAYNANGGHLTLKVNRKRRRFSRIDNKIAKEALFCMREGFFGKH